MHLFARALQEQAPSEGMAFGVLGQYRIKEGCGRRLRRSRWTAIPAKERTAEVSQFYSGGGVFPPGEKAMDKVFTEVKAAEEG